MEKCVLCAGGLGRDCVAGRGDSQSKHTRSILIPRSVAVNVEAEAEYISRRRNEVSLLVNKQAGSAGAGRVARGARAPLAYRNSISTTSVMC